MALYVTQPRPFGAPARGVLPPQALMDATSDAELVALLWEMEAPRLEAEVKPPPNPRHLAVRTGKRYSKTSPPARHGREPLARDCRVPLPLARARVPMGRSPPAGAWA